jgi:ABC-type sugar transport system ATPase subunit
VLWAVASGIPVSVTHCDGGAHGATTVGMQGMGQLDLFRAMFGDVAPDAGQISVDGRPVELTSPRAAIDARMGISLVPEERKVEALALRLADPAVRGDVVYRMSDTNSAPSLMAKFRCSARTK